MKNTKDAEFFRPDALRILIYHKYFKDMSENQASHVLDILNVIEARISEILRDDMLYNNIDYFLEFMRIAGSVGFWYVKIHALYYKIYIIPIRYSTGKEIKSIDIEYKVPDTLNLKK